MAEIFKPLSNEIYLDWINTIIEEASDELTMWESNFITDLLTKLIRSTYKLSEKQHEILERIYAEKTK